jgi:hypothetical protein
MRGRGSLRDKDQLEVVDDSVHHGMVGEESDDLHLSAALRAEQWVNFIDLVEDLVLAVLLDELLDFLDDQVLAG